MNTEVANFKIVPAQEASPEALAAFYDAFFYSRRFPLKDTWQWQNRAILTNQNTPLIMLDGNRVIAHAGIIPFELRFEDKNYSTSWYIDFMVDKAYRRMGLGLKITTAFTQLSAIYFAVTGNEKSMGAFRKLGWAESKDSFIHYIPLRPFNHPKFTSNLNKFLRSIFNTISYPLIYLNLLKFRTQQHIEHIPITETLINKLEHTTFHTKRWTPVRNAAYWRWRLLESPDANTYKCFQIANQYLIYKSHYYEGNKAIELLFLPVSLKEEEKLVLVGSLSLWALQNGYSYVRLYTTIPAFSKRIKASLKSFITYPEFAFKATDPSLFQILKENPNWDFQFIDNDFEVL